MDFFSFFRKKQTPPSGSVAKDRLKLVLVHDRVNCSSQVLEMLKTDIIKVISNYMEIDTDELDIRLRRRSPRITTAPFLCCMRISPSRACVR